MSKYGLIAFCLLVLALPAVMAQKKKQPPALPETKATVWTRERANSWYGEHPWLTGADYIPHTAINQLEMWQASTFDPQTIDRELGWAQDIGFNTLRVFLHSLAWKQDREGFKKRMDQFLAIADRHHIQPLLVFFDDCWNESAAPGKQPEPKAGKHNSGWLQDPGIRLYKDTGDLAVWAELEKYVKDVLTYFAHDKRILLWDLYNEPGKGPDGSLSLPLVRRVFQWARDINPDQPLTAGINNWDMEALNTFQLNNSDIITYHDYESPEWHKLVIQLLKAYGRPLICTEYMARPRNSRFSNILPLLKAEHVGAINWGFVSGKTNTIYAWDTPLPDGSEPAEWFHDIFRADGTPYRQDEVNLIKKLNGIK